MVRGSSVRADHGTLVVVAIVMIVAGAVSFGCAVYLFVVWLDGRTQRKVMQARPTYHVAPVARPYYVGSTQVPRVQQAKKTGCGWGTAVFAVVIVLWIVGAISGTPDGSTATNATATPGARDIPFYQLTGAQWLALSFSDQTALMNRELKVAYHCPVGVNANDLAIGITQSAELAAGKSMRVSDILFALIDLQGCVPA
jgi:hypothetical protein